MRFTLTTHARGALQERGRSRPRGCLQSVLDALRSGPYGRCVYACDNDVVDHQVVSMEFEGGRTATFTMTAFNRGGHRKTRVFGTRGEIYGDGETITHYDFLIDRTQEIDTTTPDPTVLGGHGGGDFGLMHSFVATVARNDPALVLSGPQETSRATSSSSLPRRRAPQAA